MATVGCPRDPASRDGTGYGKDKDFRNRTDRENYLGRIDGHDIRTVQELLGHKDVSTHDLHPCVQSRGRGVRSPVDELSGSLKLES